MHLRRVKPGWPEPGRCWWSQLCSSGDVPVPRAGALGRPTPRRQKSPRLWRRCPTKTTTIPASRILPSWVARRNRVQDEPPPRNAPPRAVRRKLRSSWTPRHPSPPRTKKRKPRLERTFHTKLAKNTKGSTNSESGGVLICHAIARLAKPAVAIHLAGLLRRPLRATPRNDKPGTHPLRALCGLGVSPPKPAGTSDLRPLLSVFRPPPAGLFGTPRRFSAIRCGDEAARSCLLGWRFRRHRLSHSV